MTTWREVIGDRIRKLKAEIQHLETAKDSPVLIVLCSDKEGRECDCDYFGFNSLEEARKKTKLPENKWKRLNTKHEVQHHGYTFYLETVDDTAGALYLKAQNLFKSYKNDKKDDDKFESEKRGLSVIKELRWIKNSLREIRTERAEKLAKKVERMQIQICKLSLI